ncbi:unnamed protein product [Pleuronectes platessa]|uniref:Uncharacterized protein n=1 Tax=Pleuronectes platessa TaxID=8262 RepID=A0A9N7YIZ9_PLEPL|nr:unnamed protein product [Pleuronectes platessa]
MSLQLILDQNQQFSERSYRICTTVTTPVISWDLADPGSAPQSPVSSCRRSSAASDQVSSPARLSSARPGSAVQTHRQPTYDEKSRCSRCNQSELWWGGACHQGSLDSDGVGDGGGTIIIIIIIMGFSPEAVCAQRA